MSSRNERDAEFIELYLREIGVHTPVSLSASGVQEESAVKADAVQKTSAEAESAPVMKPVSGTGLTQLAAKAADCRLCRLAETRNKVVFGTGSEQADVVFIGEAPGQEEDQQGEPFVGRAGQLLDRMLAATGLERSSVYIMNTIKCRPPNNRDPKVDEVQACNLWFEQQLDLLQPKVLCLLGRVAARSLLETDAPLGSLRGRWHEYRGIPVWVTYHPAYLLRSPSQKKKSWQDLLAMLARLQG
ncbi:MAG: uracil-DNA glycosylase [Mariprofundaceae bacterium]